MQFVNSFRVWRAIRYARLRRWWYLLLNATYTGECAVTIYDADTGKVSVIGSGRPVLGAQGEYVNYRIFWTRGP